MFAGLMAGTREAKVSQVRTAALEALGDVLQVRNHYPTDVHVSDDAEQGYE